MFISRALFVCEWWYWQYHLIDLQHAILVICRGLFGEDDNVADTFGISFAKKKKDEKKNGKKDENKSPKTTLPIKKVDHKKGSDSEDVSSFFDKNLFSFQNFSYITIIYICSYINIILNYLRFQSHVSKEEKKAHETAKLDRVVYVI